MDKNKLKNYFIIALIVVIGLFGIFGGRAVQKYREEINLLKSNKAELKIENLKLDEQKAVLNDSIKTLTIKIEELMGVFRIKDRQIFLLQRDLDSALVFLNFVTADSSYQFLQEVAYNYPGVLKYLFNEPQVKHIHSDYLVARSSEKIIPALTSQINNCKEQFTERDNEAGQLRRLNALQQKQLDNCDKISTSNDKIISDLEKQREKEKWRKNFWRTTSAVLTGACIVLTVFVL